MNLIILKFFKESNRTEKWRKKKLEEQNRNKTVKKESNRTENQ